MKFAKETFKYLRSNGLVWVVFGLAAVAFAMTVDTSASARVLSSAHDGVIDAGIGTWIKFFLPVNTYNVWTVLMGVVGYIILILDLTFLCATCDRHMRYNSLSPRGLLSSVNNNILPCLMFVLILIVAYMVLSVIFAAVMVAFCAMGPYVFIVGIVINAAILCGALFALVHFMLWLPCYLITGFRTLESLSYASSLTAGTRRGLIASCGLPALVMLLLSFLLPLVAPSYVATVVLALLDGLFFIYAVTMSFIAYMDADGIEREDLRKY